MIGQAVLDYIMSDRYDPKYGCTYKAMTCINNDDLASRCRVRDANKVVYAIKASSKQNNDMCISLRSSINNGYVNLLSSENNIDDRLKKHIKGWGKFTDNQKGELRLPFYQTTFLIDELINLEHDVSNGLIKVREKSGMRKDRYSSLEYNIFVAEQIKLKKRRNDTTNNILDLLPVRAGKRFSLYS